METTPEFRTQLQRYFDSSPVFVGEQGRHYTPVATVFGSDDGTTEVVFDRTFADVMRKMSIYLVMTWCLDVAGRMKQKLVSSSSGRIA